MSLAAIPSPPSPTLGIGALMLHYYAVFILAGVLVAGLITARRWRMHGGQPGLVVDVLLVAVPLGIAGARLYHVATSWQAYLGPAGHPARVFAIWDGGLGVWGGIAGGALGAFLVCRHRGISFAAFAAAAAPAVPVGQAIGRVGCYFNQELYGRPSHLPWAIVIDAAHRPPATPNAATYHPTFAYEALWNLGVAGLVLWAQRRFRLGGARATAVYVAGYTAGRAWIETLRVDTANHLLGMRLNVWTSLILFVVAVAFLLTRRVTASPAAAGDAGTPSAPAAAPVAGRGGNVAVAEPACASGPPPDTVAPPPPAR
jgi:prolipoprotein diacylglyceryl transferase